MMFGMIFFTSTVGEILAFTLFAPVWSRNVTWMPSPSAITLLLCTSWTTDLFYRYEFPTSLPFHLGRPIPLEARIDPGLLGFHFHDIIRRHAEFPERPQGQRAPPLDHMDDVGRHRSAAGLAGPLPPGNEREGTKDLRLRAAGRTGDPDQEIAIQMEPPSLRRLEQAFRRIPGAQRQGDRLAVGLVTEAGLLPLISGRVEIVRLSVPDHGGPGADRHPVEQLEGLLGLEPRDHRRDRRSRRNLALGDVLPPQER